MKPGAGGLFNFLPNLRSAVEVVDFEADHGEQIGLVEKLLRVGEAHEAHGRVVLIKARVKGAGNAEALVLRCQAQRREFALRTSNEHAVANRGANLVGQIAAQNDGRLGRVGRALAGYTCRHLVRFSRLQLFRRAGGHGVEYCADVPLISRNDALDHGKAGARPARNQHVAVEPGSRGNHMWQLAEAGQQRPPIANAVGFDAHQVDCRGRSQQLVLQIAPHACRDGQRNNECGYSRGDAGD